ncbi:DUF814 domain-containing protein [Candidatus Pacearchaeota archaeon]|nr:DUF814 domain-containing protein [Candidatus Pacearchaeota archaeon]
MQSLIKDFKKYKWFVTSNGKLVIGGKSAAQNDALLNKVKSERVTLIVMHTTSPGSPFTVILSPLSKISDKEMEECAIFTGCFSQAWKSGKRSTEVDIFRSDQLYKSNKMKEGMWGVNGKIERKKVILKLVLTIQKDILRAVPELSIKTKKDSMLIIIPGKTDKNDLFDELDKTMYNFTKEEFLSALPAGGSKII